MKCILLCAGYATRLFPLTENFPKGLLEIEEGKPLLNYIMEKIEEVKEIDGIYIITNNRYYRHYCDWVGKYKPNKPTKVINDKSTSNDDRLGAIGDLKYTLDVEGINDDIIVIAGDNLFDYSLTNVIDYYNKKKAPVVCAMVENDVEVLKGLAVAKLDSDDRILESVEKPQHPESNVGLYATYIYPKEVIKEIGNYLAEGNKPDAPGYLVSYLYKKMPFYAYKFTGHCYDIGTHRALDEVRRLYRKEN